MTYIHRPSVDYIKSLSVEASCLARAGPQTLVRIYSNLYGKNNIIWPQLKSSKDTSLGPTYVMSKIVVDKLNICTYI